jgi:hypothetical protein
MEDGNLESAPGNPGFEVPVLAAQFDAFVEVGHGMFAVLGFFGFIPCFLKNLEGASLDIQADGIGAMPGRWEAVAGKIVISGKQGIADLIDQIRVDQGTIGGDADHHIRPCFPGGLIIAIKDIK